MFQLTEPTLVPDGAILRADEYQALLKANDIIQDAERRAAEIVQQAEDQYVVRKQEGYEDGLLEGQMEMSEKMFDTVASSVDYVSSLETKVVDLVLKCLKKVLGDMPAEDRVTSVVRNALAVTRNETKVTIRVCPDDLETVQAHLTEITKPYPGIRFVDVVADARLSADDCILETDIGVVEASLEVQIRAIEKSIAKSVTGETAN